MDISFWQCRHHWRLHWSTDGQVFLTGAVQDYRADDARIIEWQMGKMRVLRYDRRGALFQHFTFGGDLGNGIGLPDHAGKFHGLLRKLDILHHL